MTTREWITYVLLALGVAGELLCCAGVVVKRDVFDRLHYAAAGSTLPAILIGAGILVRQSVSSAGLSTIVAVGLLFLLNPALTHATARVAYRGVAPVSDDREPAGR